MSLFVEEFHVIAIYGFPVIVPLYTASNTLGYKQLLERLVKKAELIKQEQLIKGTLF